MSLRSRLILGYSLLLLVVFLIFGTGLYLILRYNLIQQIDGALEESSGFVLRPDAILYIEKIRLISIPALPFPSSDAYAQFWDINGTLQAASPNLEDVTEPLDARNMAVTHEEFSDNMIRGVNLRVFSKPIILAGGQIGVLQVATPRTVVDRALEILLLVLLTGGIVSVGASSLLGNWIAQNALRPIETVTRSALQITRADDLSRRIPLEVPPTSETGRLVLAFNETLERLEKLFTAQSRFLADVSHELRTPLTAIRGNVDLLRKTGADAESLRAVESETDRMIRLVGDLLVLSRAEAGNLPLASDPVEMDTLLLEVLQQTRVLSQGEVQMEIGHLEQVVIPGDRDRLKQLLLNLVTNALQYTPQGGCVVLSLRTVGEWLHLTVSDNGQGIPPQDLPHIFDRFYRVEPSRNRNSPGGFGLGLSIARWIAIGHGGRIEAASELGKGTTVSVWLPLTKPAS
jgi:two-component system OmpR family sensor kinase